MKSRYAPSPTLLLHVAVLLIGALLTIGFTTKVKLAPASGPAAARDIRLETAAPFRMPIGAGAVLHADSRWRAVGSLAQGTVYRPLNQVLVLQGQLVAEAWPVIKSGLLTGFFLPAEDRFAPVQKAVPLPIAATAS